MDVEIKVTVSSGVGLAVAALGLASGGKARQVAFLEDASVGQDLPLLRAGVVLRVRQSSDGDVGSTVKLRPCRASQVGAAWRARRDDEGEPVVRIEQDRSGRRRVLAASLDADRGDHISIARAQADPSLTSKLFDDDQERFLAECGGVTVDLDQLRLLGPIEARKWSTVPALADLDAVAERWTVDDLDFLEVSLRAGEAKADGAQRDLEAALRLVGLGPFDEQSTKTETVLRHLLGTAPA